MHHMHSGTEKQLHKEFAHRHRRSALTFKPNPFTAGHTRLSVTIHNTNRLFTDLFSKSVEELEEKHLETAIHNKILRATCSS